MGRLFGTDGVRGPRQPRPHRRARARPVGRRRPRARRPSGRSRTTARAPSSAATRAPRGSSSPPRPSPGWPAPASTSSTSACCRRPRSPTSPAQLGADLGVVLSASHNPMPDNGIKFFTRGGVKLDDAVEDAIEARLREPWDRPTGAAVGRVKMDTGRAGDEYVAHLVGHDRHRRSRACGSPSTARTAPRARSGRRRCARRAPTSSSSTARPDGRNINEKCGSTHPEQLQAVDGRVRRRPRGRLRRRRGPLPRGRPHRCPRGRRPDHGRAGDRDARRRDARPRHPRGDRDEQPRPEDRDDDGRHPHPGDRRRGPLRARGDAGRRVQPRRRAVRPRHHGGARHDRRRRPHRAPARVPGRGHRAEAVRARRRRAAAAAGPGQRRGRRQGPRRRPTTTLLAAVAPRGGASSARPAACCCARPARSRSCASWSRPPARTTPSASPAGSPTSCATGSRSDRPDRPPAHAADVPTRLRADRSSTGCSAARTSAPIVQAGHPVLRRPALPYEGQLDDVVLGELLALMRRTMHAAPGVGLAAPQIGIPLAIAVLEDPGAQDADVRDLRERPPLPYRVLVNPRYAAVGDERAAFYEGCLSVRGWQAVVARHRTVHLTGQDETGSRARRGRHRLAGADRPARDRPPGRHAVRRPRRDAVPGRPTPASAPPWRPSPPRRRRPACSASRPLRPSRGALRPSSSGTTAVRPIVHPQTDDAPGRVAPGSATSGLRTGGEHSRYRGSTRGNPDDSGRSASLGWDERRAGPPRAAGGHGPDHRS